MAGPETEQKSPLRRQYSDLNLELDRDFLEDIDDSRHWTESRLLGWFVLVSSGWLASLFPSVGWMSDICASLTQQFIITYILLFALSLFKKRAILASLCALAIAINLFYLAPYLPKTKALASNAANSATVLHANAAGFNSKNLELVETLAASGADVIGVCELTPDLDRLIKTKLKDYPYIFSEPHKEDYFGLGIYSKLPLKQPHLLILENDSEKDQEIPPSILSEVVTKRGSFNLVYVHTRPPLGSQWAGQRDRQLDYLADLTGVAGTSPDRPWLLAGDLNATPFNPAFARLVKKGGFIDSNQKFGLTNTWPSGFMPPQLPLDHILARDSKTASLTISGLKTVDLPGSDHKGLFANVELNK